MYSSRWNCLFASLSSAFIHLLFCTLLQPVHWHYTEALNKRPIIGILAQESTTESFLKHGDSFIRTSYVKFLEMAGARTVPIRVKENDSYYNELFSKINGVLFPGGNVGIVSSDYALTGKKLYDMAIKSTDSGDPFPMWGTCQGFQLLSSLTAGADLLVNCDAENLTLPLHFTSDFRTSPLYKNLPTDLTDIVSTSGITQNNHHYCLTLKTHQNNEKLKTFYHVSSTNVDRKGIEFISTMEAYNYPFYGVQYHPEKNVFDWGIDLAVNHSKDAIRFTQYLANLFVEEAKKSSHRFPGASEEAEALFDNYSPVFWGPPSFHSVYFFDFPSSERNGNKESDSRSMKQIMVDKSDQHFYLVSGGNGFFVLQIIGAFCLIALIAVFVLLLITKIRPFAIEYKILKVDSPPPGSGSEKSPLIVKEDSFKSV